jgi:hypothetical protein
MNTTNGLAILNPELDSNANWIPVHYFEKSYKGILPNISISIILLIEIVFLAAIYCITGRLQAVIPDEGTLISWEMSNFLYTYTW